MWPLNYDNSGVTVELGELIKNGFDVWENFEFDDYRPNGFRYYGGVLPEDQLKELFQRHYWFRQIGQETPGRFRHYVQSRCAEILPKYFQLYASESTMNQLEDPFGNVDITETFEQETTGQMSATNRGENSGQSTGENSFERSSNGSEDKTGERLFSNTPQGSIENINNYLTEATKETQGSERSETENYSGNQSETTSETSSGESSGTSAGTVKHTLTRRGNQGVNTYAHDMKELRETFLNIGKMFVEEFNDLFLMVY